MPKAPLLSEAEIEERMRSLHGWSRDGDRLRKVFAVADFAEAVAFVEALVGPSDEQNHHPDVAIHWNEVTLTLWTHASGGITERDFHLAETIDHLTEELDAHP